MEEQGTMATAEPSDQECPVCHDDFTQPKILHCAHIVCRSCVISWLSMEDNQGGCPLCRAPILPASSQGQSDLGSAVDALPTDLMMAAAVESQHILNSANRCVCDGSTEAKFLCLQCRIKLCDSCAKSHLKSPAIQHHILEDLNNISKEKLAGFHQSSCNSHENKTAELYCRSHGELICVLCASSEHRQCVDVGGIKEAAKVQREELKKELERLKAKDSAVEEKIKELDRQIADGRAKGQKARADIKATIDDLKQTLDDQCEKLVNDSSQEEEAYIAEKNTPRADLMSQRAGLRAQTHLMAKVVSASDDFLLSIQDKLKAHLHDLEAQDIEDETGKGTRLESSLDPKLVSALKQLICKLGKVGEQDPVCSLCRRHELTGLGGAEYAALMKVGDRVRRGKDWLPRYGNPDGNPPGPGTITFIKSGRLQSRWGVRVKWDTGKSDNYRMGCDDKYDLQLV